MKKNTERGFETVRSAGEMLADLLWPPRCPVCDEIRPFGQKGACPACRRSLPYVKTPWCMCCGRQMEPDEAEEEYCFACSRRARTFDRGRIIFLYEGKFRESVLRMKFHNRRDYIGFYGEEMARLADGFLRACRPQAIVPVPMHVKKQRKRGYNQSLLLSRALSRETGIPVRDSLIIRNRNTLPSKALGAERRRENLRGAFSLREGAAVPARILIVDDIFTTGATVEEMSLTLRRGGAKEICFLALCGVHA